MKILHFCCLALIAIATLFTLVTCQDAPAAETDNKNDALPSQRRQRIFPVFQIVTFQNAVCDGTSRNGTCYTPAECSSKGGVSSGTCASGYGVCCVFTLSCGSTTSQNASYLVQASTTKAPSTQPCTYTICKCSSNICRIKLDFTTFQIAGPQVGTTAPSATAITTNGGGIGDCISDSFSLTSPGNSGSPIICGFNTGQHMIVDASDSCSVAAFQIGSTSDTRNWDIKVTQYACGDANGGPDGCLQYFTGVSGKVSSFNFPTTAASVGATTTHLSSQCYTMCFRQEAGKCSICFTTAVNPTTIAVGTQISFGLSASPSPAIAQSDQNTDCSTDYLQIQGASATGPSTAASTVERLCGRVFSSITGSAIVGATVCTSTIPFRIQFKTDANEVAGLAAANTNEQVVAPGGIVGFSLAYVELAC